MLIGPQSIRKLLLAGLVLLAGCETGKNNIEDWSNVPERREAVANRVFYTHDVLFSGTQTTLNESQGRRLQLFIDNTRIGATDKVFLVPQDSAQSGLRVQAVAEFLAAGKIRINASPGRQVGPPGPAVSIIVSRYVVSLPGCPDWSDERFTYNNVPTSNWGCANATNLGRMVARPEDLANGRDPGPSDGQYGARSIDLYRKGETKPLTTESIGPIENQQNTSSQPSTGSGG